MAKTKKAELREEVGKRVSALSASEQVEKSAAACRRLLDLPELQQAERIALYATLLDEIDVWPVIRWLHERRRHVVLPRCLPRQRRLLCLEVTDLRELAPGTFHILEPRSGRVVSETDVDVVITPGRAFDLSGNRVGRGAGYYDRFFLTPGMRAFKCGVAFDCQIYPAVPHDENDVPVDAIVTESRLWRNHFPSA